MLGCAQPRTGTGLQTCGAPSFGPHARVSFRGAASRGTKRASGWAPEPLDKRLLALPTISDAQTAGRRIPLRALDR